MGKYDSSLFIFTADHGMGTHGGISCRDVPLAFMGPTIKKGEFVQDTIPELADILPTIYNIWSLAIPTYMDE